MPDMAHGVQTCTLSRGLTQGRKQIELRSATQTQTAVQNLQNITQSQQSKKVINQHNLVEAWYSLEQYIGLKEDKLSSTTVDFIRSEGNLETKRLYWFSKPKMC